MSDSTAFRYLTDAREAALALEAMRGESVVGLDTETYWDAKISKSRVSLVQVAAPSGDVIVVDALATGFDPVRPLVEEPSVRMAAHNARFDQGVLRGEELKPTSFVDTLSLARSALVLPSYSLASVTEHLFGFPLDKTLQSSNWRRPLIWPTNLLTSSGSKRFLTGSMGRLSTGSAPAVASMVEVLPTQVSSSSVHRPRWSCPRGDAPLRV